MLLSQEALTYHILIKYWKLGAYLLFVRYTQRQVKDSGKRIYAQETTI